jgi:hypothetical protein
MVLLQMIEDAVRPGIDQEQVAARKYLQDRLHMAWMLDMAGLLEIEEKLAAWVDKTAKAGWAFTVPRSDYEDWNIAHKLRQLVSTADDHRIAVEKTQAWIEKTAKAKEQARALRAARRLAKAEHRAKLAAENAQREADIAAGMAAHRARNAEINAKYRTEQHVLH